MSKAFRHLAAAVGSVPGHSLLFLLLATGLFGASGYAPSALAWVLRILGFGALGMLAALLRSDLPQVAAWLATGPLAIYHGVCRLARHHRTWLRRYELLLAAAILLLSGLHFSQSVGAMAHASLRVDEVGSVRSYTSRGPITSATKYSLAKNHIFFSVVNSLTPGSGSLHPARARLWSFVSVGLALVILAAYFWRLGSPLAGAVAVALPALNLDLLTKVFEARGYGFLTLAAVCGLTSLHAFLRTARPGFLWVFGISVALGTWTLPFYVVFGGVLMLLLFLVRPSRATLMAGLACAIAIAALYSPVLLQLAQVAGGYDEKYGEEFSSIAAVFSAMSYAVPASLLPVDDAAFLGLVLLILLVPLVLPRSNPADRKALQIGAVAVIGFYLFCLILATPPQRITAFLAMPVAFVVGMLAFQVLTFPSFAGVQPVLATLLAAAILPLGVKSVAEFPFEPDQRWRDAAQAARALCPDGAEIFMPSYRNTLAEHLDGGYVVKGRLPDAPAMPSGRYLVFDPAHKSTHAALDVAQAFPQIKFQAVRFPLLGPAEQVLYVPVPEALLIPAVLAGPTQVPLPVPVVGEVVVPLPPVPSRTLYLLSNVPVEDWRIAARTVTNGVATPLPAKRIQRTGNLIALDLSSIAPPESIVLQLSPQKSAEAPEIQSIWTLPSAPASSRASTSGTPAS